ncbi:hypothetical protein CE91St62_30550 [Lachnospiraceae bacterium]|uniref:DUF975 family protein n=1 Tax=Extibacter sp. GGCC_0201 TaxID=2731209 RepID=UPI001AA14929|nr:DUF975 family protein [Extibacter sp. GGCC_0201]MBO1721358.1 DUF975 family protein [Extibacter sp. GGCC_0201]BDF34992.1 hypothetical protein CE91St61_30670 [Lachnospiraceae bacterium]BDF38994.1 hypothetical protein CE91St62_30550 [Lachnospiraceae bacterium]
MMTRKEMKKAAKRNVKRHYILLVAVCLIAAFLNSEFSGSLNSLEVNVQESSGGSSGDMGKVAGQQAGAMDVARNLLEGREKEGKELSRKIEKQQIEQSKGESPVLGRSRGVLAQAVNAVTSGSVFVTVIAAVNSMVKSQEITLLIFIILGMFLLMAFWFFVKNMYIVVSRRIFMEGRCYDAVPIQRFLFLLRLKKWMRAAWIMFVEFMYKFFWMFTIVGGIVKTFSYFLVPYIVAENPDMTARQAITLSRRMMKGHKWECFLFHLSFAGWYILGMLTFGLSAVFYSNPYETASFTEYYIQLRRLAKDKGIPGADMLCDTYLFEKAGEDEIRSAYVDAIAVLERPAEEMKELRGIRRFFAEHLGILLLPSEEERAYEEDQAERIRIHSLRGAVERKSYPGRLSPVPEVEKRQKVETIHYMRHYSVWSLIMMFFVFSFIGWLWEVSLHLVEDGAFVNRGVLHGPWLPIYGSGGVLILVLLKKLRARPVAEFAGIVILCGMVEYFTSYYLELTHNGQKWWDYSGYFLNLNGRICAEGLLVFGIGGMAFAYVLAPLLDNLIRRVQMKLLIPVCLLLLCVYAADTVYSSGHPNTGKGITDYESRQMIPVHVEKSVT